MLKTDTYMVPAVEKSVRILEFITGSREGCSLKDIHTGLGIAKTSTFSILNTLIQSGLVRKDQKGRFIPTLKLTAMGLRARELNNEMRFVRLQLEKLRDSTGFTVFYCIYDNGEQIVLEKLDGPSTVVFKAYIGERRHVNMSANGKAMAAFLSPRELEFTLEKIQERPPAGGAEDFRSQLDEVRQRGYAVEDGETEAGIRCIGAPVFMYDGRLYGAVSISTLGDSLPMADIPRYAELLMKTAAVISSELGYKG